MVCLILYNTKRTYIIIDDNDDDYMEDPDPVPEAQRENPKEEDHPEEEQQQAVPEKGLGLCVRVDLMATMTWAPGHLDRVRHP